MKRIALLAVMGFLFLSGNAFAAKNEVAISYVKSPFNLQMIVMKEHGLLEKELAPLGVSVSWPEINSGSKQAQAMASGDLDICGVMNSTSLLMAASEGMPIKIIAGVARPTDVFALMGRKGGPASIKELRGKTIAGPKGTVLHQLLVAALATEGMTLKDVQFLQMDIPQSFAAMQGGKVDAALLAANMVIKAEEEGAAKIATATGLVVPKLAMMGSDSFIKNHPDRLKAAIAAHDKAWQWITENHDEAIALGAKIQGISIEDAERLFEWSYFTQRFNQSDIESMKDDMQFLLDNDMMRKTVDVSTLIIPEAME
ncbi:NrtA/SsuA/CpmA family ABC transporter substrate-binding protein [Desulfovibrio sp. OttesenSCG-928-I05]|nr:NrtA/SsuA/CpmA family ABC transporter substrate-binding protein [Desulfovibrio sp. OttesenSCG-928-I05]